MESPFTLHWPRQERHRSPIVDNRYIEVRVSCQVFVFTWSGMRTVTEATIGATLRAGDAGCTGNCNARQSDNQPAIPVARECLPGHGQALGRVPGPGLSSRLSSRVTPLNAPKFGDASTHWPMIAGFSGFRCDPDQAPTPLDTSRMPPAICLLSRAQLLHC